MTKSNAERQKGYRLRKQQRIERTRTAIAEGTRLPWEQAMVDCADAGAPPPRAPPRSGDFALGPHLAEAAEPHPAKRYGTTAREELEKEPLTREWVLAQLRLIALDPLRASPASVHALKVLLTELPKGQALDATTDGGPPAAVQNVVRVRRPRQAAIDIMVKERAKALGIELPETITRPARMIGDGHEDEGVGAPVAAAGAVEGTASGATGELSEDALAARGDDEYVYDGTEGDTDG